tara:strand:- start:380 stop:1162 length:783 start_codon:yes stop_codon:yes gene_type:complete
VKSLRLIDLIFFKEYLNFKKLKILDKPKIMKKLFTFILFSLFINTAIAQTNTFTVYYFDVKRGMESSLADVFDSFYEGVEFKSGGVYLERMHRGDVSGTHRVVAFGELGKFGVADGQKTSQDWEQFRTNRNKFIEKNGPSYSGRIMLSNGVDPFSKGYFQLYEGKIYELEKFTAAHSKAMKDVWDYNGNAMLFGTYDVGAPGGATHWAAFGADNLESLMQWKVYIEENNAKGQAEYFKTRGKAEDLTNYSLTILKQYGGF